ncbi:MAG: hypothetical protein ACRENH_12610 [Gemmatimonadaceae bacterium]
MQPTSNSTKVLLAAILVAGSACAPTAAFRTSLPQTARGGGLLVREEGPILLGAELDPRGCGAVTRRGLRGSARMELRDAIADSSDGGGGSELEYELTLDNPGRRPLTGAVVIVRGVDETPRAGHTAVLWNGPPISKERVRMRGIVALPRPITTTSVAAALRERRASFEVRVSAQNGSVAACGTLRQ